MLVEEKLCYNTRNSLESKEGNQAKTMDKKYPINWTNCENGCKIFFLKMSLQESKSCFAWTKVLNCWILFIVIRKKIFFSSLWTNKIIKLLPCKRGHLKNRPWWILITAAGHSLPLFIGSDIKINAEYYQKNILNPLLGAQIFRFKTMDISISLSTAALCSR